MTALVGTIRLFNHHINVGYYLLAVIDLFLFALAGYGGSALYFAGTPGGVANAPNLIAFSTVFAVGTTLAMFSMGLYEPRLREGPNGILLRTLGAFALMTVAMTLLFYVVPDLHIARGNFGISATLALAATIMNRVLWTRLIDQEQFKRRVLVLGAGRAATSINRRMRRKADRRGMRIVGYVRQGGEQSHIEGEPTLTLDCPLSEYVRRNSIDEIVIALEDRRNNLPQEELMHCRAAGVRVMDVVDFFEQEAGKVLIEHLHPSWFTFNGHLQRSSAARVSKRVFDVTMGFLLLMVAWPFMLLTVFAIWLEDGLDAPVLFRQRRVGLNGRIFDVIKFRSMTVNAEGDGRARWATSDDCRITLVGRFIRKTRIDELPQLLNVLAGDMAFVGPRPERPEFVLKLREGIPYYDKRHCVKPGITGWAQTNYPYGASVEDSFHKLEYDLYYVRHQSLFLDFLVLLQTAEVVLFGKGAR